MQIARQMGDAARPRPSGIPVAVDRSFRSKTNRGGNGVM